MTWENLQFKTNGNEVVSFFKDMFFKSPKGRYSLGDFIVWKSENKEENYKIAEFIYKIHMEMILGKSDNIEIDKLIKNKEVILLLNHIYENLSPVAQKTWVNEYHQNVFKIMADYEKVNDYESYFLNPFFSKSLGVVAKTLLKNFNKRENSNVLLRESIQLCLNNNDAKVYLVAFFRSKINEEDGVCKPEKINIVEMVDDSNVNGYILNHKKIILFEKELHFFLDGKESLAEREEKVINIVKKYGRGLFESIIDSEDTVKKLQWICDYKNFSLLEAFEIVYLTREQKEDYFMRLEHKLIKEFNEGLYNQYENDPVSISDVAKIFRNIKEFKHLVLNDSSISWDSLDFENLLKEIVKFENNNTESRFIFDGKKYDFLSMIASGFSVESYWNQQGVPSSFFKSVDPKYLEIFLENTPDGKKIFLSNISNLTQSFSPSLLVEKWEALNDVLKDINFNKFEMHISNEKMEVKINNATEVQLDLLDEVINDTLFEYSKLKIDDYKRLITSRVDVVLMKNDLAENIKSVKSMKVTKF